MIKRSHLLSGIFLCLERVDNHLEISEKLHDLGNYLQSASISTIGFEEAMKGMILADKFRNSKGLSSDEWNKITTHEYRLKKYHKEVNEREGFKSEDEFAKILNHMTKLGLLSRADSLSNLQDQIREDLEIYPKLQTLRERCFYTDWNLSKNNWYQVTNIKNKDLESLSVFILAEASLQQRYLLLDIEVIVNGLRKNNIEMKNLSFPNYDEYRSFNEYQSWDEIKDLQNKIEVNRKKIDRGLQIFRKIVST